MPAKQVDTFKSEISEISKQIAEIQDDNCQLNLRLASVEGSNIRLQNKVESLESQLEDVLCRGMEKNLIFFGIEENKQEDCKSVMNTFFQNHMKIPKKNLPQVGIDVSHRIGRLQQGRTRAMLVSFVTKASVSFIKSYATNLKGTAYRFSDHLPREVRARRSALVPRLIALKEEFPDRRVNLVRDKLSKDGKLLPSNFTVNPIRPKPMCPVAFSYENDFFHTEIKMEKQSSFQAHARTVKSLVEAQASLQALFQDAQTADSTHIIYAYSVTDANSNLAITGHSDDGEWSAGSSLADLLREEKVANTFVAVRRTYGGTDLGKRRFAIITELAKEILGSMGSLELPPSQEY